VAKIYISSTFEDLKDYREAVYRALRRDRHDVIAMEDYVAQDQRPLQKCLEDVASCNIYIGIFAWRYGFIPVDEKDNPEGLSITELEYRKAKEKDIPCLIFLLDENKDWPLRSIDGTAQSGIKSDDNINRLRNEFQEYYVISFFKNPDQLAGLVVPAVENTIQDKNMIKVSNEVNDKETSKYFIEILKDPEIQKDIQKAIIKAKQQQEGSNKVMENPTFYEDKLMKLIPNPLFSSDESNDYDILGGINPLTTSMSKEDQLRIDQMILNINERLISRLNERAKSLAKKLDELEDNDESARSMSLELQNIMKKIGELYQDRTDIINNQSH
jgi:hypothetical protein